MPVLVTDAYTRAWRAFRDVAAEHHMDPFDVRVLVALAESPGGDAVEQVLANQLGAHRPAVRRSARRLADRYLLVRSVRGAAPVTLRINAAGALVAWQAINGATA